MKLLDICWRLWTALLVVVNYQYLKGMRKSTKVFTFLCLSFTRAIHNILVVGKYQYLEVHKFLPDHIIIEKGKNKFHNMTKINSTYLIQVKCLFHSELVFVAMLRKCYCGGNRKSPLIKDLGERRIYYCVIHR